MAEMIKFFKGQLANLPEVGANGALYITTDEGAIYLGTGEGMKRLGDFVQVANVASLPANGANPSALYYCAAENILAKWNGSSWSQINKDTGMTSVEVVGEGNAVTAAEYNAETRKLTMTKGATYATPAVVDSKIATAVGTLGNDAEGNAYENVKAYVDAKTAGIATDAALSELQAKVDANEDAIEVLQGWVNGSSVEDQIDAKIEALDLANTYDAKGAAEAVQGDLDAYKESNDTAVAAAKKAGDDAQAAVDALSAKVGDVADDKTVVEMIAAAQTAATYDDTAVRGLIADNAAAIGAIAEDYLKAADKTELQGKIDAKVAQAEYDEKVAALDAEDVRIAGLVSDMDAAYKLADQGLSDRIADLEADITGLSGAMHFKGVVEALPETTEGYADGDTVICGNKEYVVNGEAFVELGDVSAEVQRISDLEGVVGDTEGGLVKDVADNTAAIAAEKARAEGKEAELAAADATNLQAAKDYADDAVEALGIGDYVKKADADAAYAAAGHDHDDKYDAIGAAAKALEDAQALIDAAKVDASNKDAVVLAEAQKGINANAEAIATKAAQSDLDAAVERIGVNEGKIAALETESAKHALKTEVAAVQSALDEYVAANDAAVAGKADKATTLAGYGITDAYTKTEIEAMLTWGSF